MLNNLKYTVKVWLFATVLPPLIVVIFLSIFFGDIQSEDAIVMLYMMMIMGMVFSTPAMLVFGLLLHIIKNTYSHRGEMVVMSIYSALAVSITFKLSFGEGFFKDPSMWEVVYAVVMIAGVWLFKKKDDIAESDDGRIN